MEKNFSLKDQLFNLEKVQMVAGEINATYPAFNAEKFTKQVVDRFPELELKERIFWIRDNLREHLPAPYREATQVLLEALPPECDPTLTDDDFGDFIYAPYGYFVSTYGCTAEDLDFSLAALKEMTTRFSAEDPIRFFINAFPEQTMKTLQAWTTDRHYHVRRLTSEGTRPKLPWAHKLVLEPGEALPILNALYGDATRFVTRSVANHLNDISKTHPALVLESLDRWQQSGKQQEKEMTFIVNHSLRTLVKQGHTETMEFLGYSQNPQVDIQDFELSADRVKVGEALTFAFTLYPQQDEKLIVDYVMHFRNKKGGLGQKVYKMKKVELKAGEPLTLEKRHPFKKNMTTRALYTGEHIVEIQINGKRVADRTFHLEV